jgi:YVTN family beta-propeller protein
MVVDSVPLNFPSHATGIVYNPANAKLYVGSDDGHMHIFGPPFYNSEQEITGPGGSQYRWLFSMGGNVFVMDCGVDGMCIIDGETNSLMQLRGTQGQGIDLNTNNGLLYAGNGESRVMILVPSLRIVDYIVTGAGHKGAAYNPNNNDIYVANYNTNTVSVIDGRTNAVIANIPGFNGPWGIAFNPPNGKMYVTNERSNLVSVIDSSSNRIIENIVVENCPTGIAYYPITRNMLVSNSCSDSVSVISTVDTTHPKVVATSPVDRAVGVPVSSAITITFNEPMSPRSFNTNTFKLTDANNNPITGTVSLSDDGLTATFTPTAALQFSTNYRATVEKSVTDMAGNDLGVTKIWSFETVSSTPHLVILKHVINDNGGTMVPSDFTIDIEGNNPSNDEIQGSEEGVSITIGEGEYAITEEAPPEYTTQYSQDCTGSISNGETKMCVVLNNDKPGILQVKKLVINDNGGTKVPPDFTIDVTGNNPLPHTFPGSDSGSEVQLDAGNYQVQEQEIEGYSQSRSTDCSGDIGLGQNKSCLITNFDIPPKLTVIKHVINDNGGTKLASDFTIRINGNNPLPASFAGDDNGVVAILNSGSYSVQEEPMTGYSQNMYGECSGNINIGESKVCTITNDDIQAP